MANSKQASLFDDYESVKFETSTNLVKTLKVKQSKNDSPSLKKLKHNFNHRINAIATLKEQIENFPKIFSFLNIKYNEIVKSTEDKLVESKLELLEVVDNVYGKKSLTEYERDFICSFMAIQLNEISEMGCEYDPKYVKYFQMEKLAESEESMDFMGEIISNMMGIDVDLKDLMGDGKLTAEEFAKKYKPQMDEKAQAFEEEKKKIDLDKNGKNGNHLDLNLHFMKLYKNLAKKIHPDLEQNEKIRRQKEVLMQELAHAKDNKDLFQLISIKFQIDKIENNEEVIDENYLKLYSDRLLEQKQTLELDIYKLKKQSGTNSWLYQNFHALHSKTTIKRMEEYRKDLEKDLVAQKQLNESLKTVKGMKNYIRKSDEKDDIFYYL